MRFSSSFTRLGSPVLLSPLLPLLRRSSTRPRPAFAEFKNKMLVHAELAKVFNLPTVLTTRAKTVEATGKKQMIVTSITT
ncbi:hypothetical protein C8Q76DRAFT_802804 [Earliella scabrosa]|nr:hypothetical protein C8Q76DRAFT_802804 [Earliella scabrosa]